MALLASRSSQSARPRASCSRAGRCAMPPATVRATAAAVMNPRCIIYSDVSVAGDPPEIEGLEIEQPRVFDDERAAKGFVRIEVGRIAPVVVDEEQPRAAAVEERQADVRREQRRLIVVLD